MKTIDFIYDFGSTNSYLVHRTLPALAARYGAQLNWCPVLLGGVFKATNNQSPMMAFAEVKGKLDYMHLEIARFIERHKIAFQMNPHFPVMTLTIMRAAVYAKGQEWEKLYLDTVFDALWKDAKKMDEPEVISQVLEDAGLPASEILQATQDPDIKAALIKATEDAVARGVYGAPTMFLEGEMFYGKDSLPDLEWCLNHRQLGVESGQPKD